MPKLIHPNDIIAIRNNETKFLYTISWKMTDWCNFHCPGCIAAYEGAMKHNSQDTINAYARKIHDFINNEIPINPTTFPGYTYDEHGVPIFKEKNGPIKLHLIGGEPTCYDLKTVIDIIGTEKLDKISVITNLSRPVSYFLDLDRFCTERGVHLKVVASYHPEFGTKKEFLDKIFELNKQLHMRMSYIIADDNFDREFIDDAIEGGVYVNTPRERDLNNVQAEIQEESTEFLQSREETRQCIYVITENDYYTFKCTAFANNAILDGGINPCGFQCSAGTTCLRIEPNGNVCRAGCAYCKVHEILGNLSDPSYSISRPTTPIICELDPEKKCNFSYRVNIKRQQL